MTSTGALRHRSISRSSVGRPRVHGSWRMRAVSTRAPVTPCRARSARAREGTSATSPPPEPTTTVTRRRTRTRGRGRALQAGRQLRGRAAHGCGRPPPRTRAWPSTPIAPNAGRILPAQSHATRDGNRPPQSVSPTDELRCRPTPSAYRPPTAPLQPTATHRQAEGIHVGQRLLRVADARHDQQHTHRDNRPDRPRLRRRRTPRRATPHRFRRVAQPAGPRHRPAHRRAVRGASARIVSSAATEDGRPPIRRQLRRVPARRRRRSTTSPTASVGSPTHCTESAHADGTAGRGCRLVVTRHPGIGASRYRIHHRSTTVLDPGIANRSREEEDPEGQRQQRSEQQPPPHPPRHGRVGCGQPVNFGDVEMLVSSVVGLVDVGTGSGGRFSMSAFSQPGGAFTGLHRAGVPPGISAT